jgi:hypothetical protein
MNLKACTAFATINYSSFKKKEQVMLCLDNDAKNNNKNDQLIHLAAEKLQEQGKLVMIAQPKTAEWDFNDVLVREGVSSFLMRNSKARPTLKLKRIYARRDQRVWTKIRCQ